MVIKWMRVKKDDLTTEAERLCYQLAKDKFST